MAEFNIYPTAEGIIVAFGTEDGETGGGPQLQRLYRRYGSLSAPQA